MTDRILVTPRSLTSAPPPALDRLVRAGFEVVLSTPGALPSEAELLRLVPGCVGWLAGVEPVSERVVAAADRLQVVSRNGSGADNLPLVRLAERGIRVERAIGANATGVAELTLGLILAACRHIPETAVGVRAGGWPRLTGREVEGGPWASWASAPSAAASAARSRRWEPTSWPTIRSGPTPAVCRWSSLASTCSCPAQGS